ncbi:hypothetical protein TNCV_3823871 [Trichonephila clavipes]|nr:hypothetical protein TNCV_3823871 [Trichonephila clavipes]
MKYPNFQASRQSKIVDEKRSSAKNPPVLKRIFMSKKRTTAAKVTAEINQHLFLQCQCPMAVRRRLHKKNIYSREAISKPLVTDVNAKHRL